jgi:hypothetical protein
VTAARSSLADMDWDRGVLDVVVANQNGPLLVYRNVPPPAADGAHWLAVDLVPDRGPGASNPDAAGAHVLARYGEHTQLRVVVLGGGFSSQGPRRVHFGLGGEERVKELEVRWPSGRVQVVRGPRRGPGAPSRRAREVPGRTRKRRVTCGSHPSS